MTIRIPKDDCSEFIVARRSWELFAKNSDRRYYAFGIMFVLEFLFMEYITGQFQSPTLFGLMLNGIFLLLAIYLFILGYREHIYGNLDEIEKRFLADFSGNTGKKAKIIMPYYCDSESNDTECDYLMMSIVINRSISSYEVEIYVRGDVVTDIVPYKSLKGETDVCLEDIKKKLDFVSESAVGARKKAFVFAKYLLAYHPDDFKEAFVIQPVLSLRYFRDIADPETRKSIIKENEKRVGLR